MENGPLFSERILGKKDSSGSLFIGPEALEWGKTYSIAGRKMKIYGDGGGKHEIRPEWMKDGITVEARTTGGRNQDAYISYRVLVGNAEAAAKPDISNLSL